ncbi:MAG: hypothetical protein IJR34_00315, partial [Bacteroidales bacterium]|nr:hypothetical protein [Bacteroidales bacterium]
FGIVDGGNLKNIKISGASMEQYRQAPYAAVLAGRAINGAVLSGCTVSSSSVQSNKGCAGTLAGELSGSTIQSCTVSDATVSGANSDEQLGTGGVVGLVSANSTFKSVSFSGKVNNNSKHAGGIVGIAYNKSAAVMVTLEDCHFSGEVASAGGSVGGIIGEMSGSSILRNCSVAPGSTIMGGLLASESNNVGGLVGFISYATGSAQAGEIASCAFRGTVIGYAARTGGLVGTNPAVRINDCLVEGATVSGVSEVGGVAGKIEGIAICNTQVKNSNVSGYHYAIGGIAGQVYGNGAEISDCLVENTPVIGLKKDLEVGARSFIGGIAGLTDGTGNMNNYVKIVCCGVTGASVKGAGLAVGGIVGSLRCPTVVDACWCNEDVCSEKSDIAGGLCMSGYCGGIVGEILEGRQYNMIINCSFYDAGVVAEGPNYGEVGGIIGHMPYAYEKGPVQDNYLVNCFSNPTLVSSGNQHVGGVAGYVTRQVIDNCYSPAADNILSSPGNPSVKGSVIGVMCRGGCVVNGYYVYQGSGSHDSATDAPLVEDTWKMTHLTEEQMRAASASVNIPSTGATVGSLVDALNQGARYYNEGGDGIGHHGNPSKTDSKTTMDPKDFRRNTRARNWSKGSSYPYPTIVGSPICDVAQ